MKKINAKICFEKMGISDSDGQWMLRKHFVWKNSHSELEDHSGKYWFFQFAEVDQMRENFKIIEISVGDV
ncbi:hypothetical protein D3C71_2149920 [compost metagenome]